MENTFFMVMFTLGSFMGLVTMVFVLRRLFSRQSGEVGGWEVRGAGTRIRAVAHATIAEAIRVKSASGFAAIILLAIPIFWLTANGDGTVKGQVQMFVSYSLGFAGFCLALLTALLACRSLSIEISGKQIYTIATKPIPRWQIVAGKWVGVMTINAAILAMAVLLTYVGTRLSVARFRSSLHHELMVYGGLTDSEASRSAEALEHLHGIGKKGMDSPYIDAMAAVLGKSRDEVGMILLRLPENTRDNVRHYDELRRQVLLARAAIPIELPDFSQEADQAYLTMQKEGRVPEGWSRSRAIAGITAAMNTEFCAIQPGSGRQWRVKGPPPDEKSADFIMSLKFTIRAPGFLGATQYQGRTLEEGTLLCHWGIGDPTKPNFLETEGTYPSQASYELEIPTQSVNEDGTVIVNFMNVDPRGIQAVFDLSKHELELLYRVGSYELNLFQAALAIMIPLGCLASFGVCASTFLSFPVGSLIVISLYIIAMSMGFVAESLAVTPDYLAPHPGLDVEIRRATVDFIGWALNIGDCDPVGQVIEGRSIGWTALWENFWKFGLIKSAIVFGIAVTILRRRELAAVIV